MPKEIMKLYVRIIMIIRNDKECLCEMNVCEALCVCVCVCVWEEADTSAFMCWMDTLECAVRMFVESGNNGPQCLSY